MTLSSGYVFPDKLPQWRGLNTYSLEKMEFQKTTIKEFRTMCPDVEPYDIGNGILIFTVKPVNISDFSEVNVGFRNEVFDWVEFVLDKQFEVGEFTSVYGFPKHIDTKYSETLDYYNYDTFSVAVDKKYFLVRSISVFAQKMPGVKSHQNETATGKIKFYEVFPGLKPGITTEREFSKHYPELLPYMEGEYDVNSVYTLVEELEGAEEYYQQAILRFEHGVLVWINLIPTYEESEELLKKYNNPITKEKLNERYDFYIYDNFVFTVDRHQKRVNSIGLVGVNNRF